MLQVEHWRAPPLDHVATGIGHHGGTYGFEMLGGYYPALNASITIATNQDAYKDFITGLCCSVVELIARHKGVVANGKGLNCTAPSAVTYTCRENPYHAEQMCQPIMGSSGTTLAKCQAKCHS